MQIWTFCQWGCKGRLEPAACQGGSGLQDLRQGRGGLQWPVQAAGASASVRLQAVGQHVPQVQPCRGDGPLLGRVTRRAKPFLFQSCEYRQSGSRCSTAG